MEHITKRFPGVIANSDVSFTVNTGEVHALLGENGAGKTTLMNVLYGLYQAEEGNILLNGVKQNFKSPKDAMRKGVGLVAQHFMLARRHTVAENIALGLDNLPTFFPTRVLRGRIRELGEHYGLGVDPDANVWQLSPGEQQRVEILKALVRGAELLILDEPTSVLTPQEANKLFEVMDQMRSEGKGLIFITHKLDEVMAIADRITVLRKGAVTGSVDKVNTSIPELAQMMVGREVKPAQLDASQESGEASPVRLSVQNISAKNERAVDGLKDVSFELKTGEILGVAGVSGNGQAELIEVLTGLRQPYKGSILLENQDISKMNAKELFEAGVAHIPEDRNHMGVVPSLSVIENLILRQYRYKPFSSGALLSRKAMKEFAEKSIRDYEIATPSDSTTTSLLSGGNVQKVILARELSGDPKLIVAAHPTYGLDVSAAQLTHRLFLEQREKGASILLVSEDLEELFRLSDRLMVMFDGQVMGIVNTAEADREEIGLLMAGIREGAKA